MAKSKFPKVEIKKGGAWITLSDSKSFRAFNLERVYSKRLGKKVHVGIGVREFENASDVKNYVLKKARSFVPTYDKRALSLLDSYGM